MAEEIESGRMLDVLGMQVDIAWRVTALASGVGHGLQQALGRLAPRNALVRHLDAVVDVDTDHLTRITVRTKELRA